MIFTPTVNGGLLSLFKDSIPATAMANASTPRKVAVKCAVCKHIFVAEVWNDGTIRPIGSSQYHPCGNNQLQIFERTAPSVG